MPKYVVSACLAGHSCRYDGGTHTLPVVQELVRRGEAVPVCPETLAGLPVPRLPCELRHDRVISKDGRDLSAEFARGARLALHAALDHGCTHAILKARSPSCGIEHVYDGTFSKKLVPGQGLWARMLAEHGLTLYSEEALPPALPER